jgi:hypothetical protein
MPTPAISAVIDRTTVHTRRDLMRLSLFLRYSIALVLMHCKYLSNKAYPGGRIWNDVLRGVLRVEVIREPTPLIRREVLPESVTVESCPPDAPATHTDDGCKSDWTCPLRQEALDQRLPHSRHTQEAKR